VPVTAGQLRRTEAQIKKALALVVNIIIPTFYHIHAINPATLGQCHQQLKQQGFLPDQIMQKTKFLLTWP